jgi:hypothetical protein
MSRTVARDGNLDGKSTAAPILIRMSFCAAIVVCTFYEDTHAPTQFAHLRGMERSVGSAGMTTGNIGLQQRLNSALGKVWIEGLIEEKFGQDR